MNIKVRIKKPRERNYRPAFVATTGNVVTTSIVSADECKKHHEEKLKRKQLEEINRQKHQTEIFSWSY